jgi:hypothetical protein
MRSIYLLIIVLGSLLMLLAVGCNSVGERNSTNTTTETPPIPTNSVADPYFFEVSFPNGAPALNQVAQLRVITVHRTDIVDDVKIEVSLPEGFILISGDLTWSADSLPYGETEVINAQIKSQKTGNWVIEILMQYKGLFISESENITTHPSHEAKYRIFVSVTEESAEWGINPPWQGQTPPQLEIHPPT